MNGPMSTSVHSTGIIWVILFISINITFMQLHCTTTKKIPSLLYINFLSICHVFVCNFLEPNLHVHECYLGIHWKSRRTLCQHPDHNDNAAVGNMYHITLDVSRQLFINQGICIQIGEGKPFSYLHIISN